jgi:hypothetical protein
VEVGLQSIGPDAMTLMDRKNNLRAFERGVRAMMGEGIRVKVDLIIGLPGDTADSVRRGLHFLHDGGLVGDLQVFNLAVLPGTAFRHEAKELGLIHQPRPPYYVLRTPMLEHEDLFALMQEAQDLFGVEWDAPPRPVLTFDEPGRVWRVDLDGDESVSTPAEERLQAFTLWLCSTAFDRHMNRACELVRDVLKANPFTTLQVVLESNGAADAVQRHLDVKCLEALTQACQESPTYLDKYYALQPGRLSGAKRIVVLLPFGMRERLDPDWLVAIGEWTTIVWQGDAPPATEAAVDRLRRSAAVSGPQRKDSHGHRNQSSRRHQGRQARPARQETHPLGRHRHARPGPHPPALREGQAAHRAAHVRLPARHRRDRQPRPHPQGGRRRARPHRL